MAFKDEQGNVVTLKQLKKQKKPTKAKQKKSLVGKKIWWIDKPNFLLYEGEILEWENTDSVLKVKWICKHYSCRGEETIRDIRVKDIQFNK